MTKFEKQTNYRLYVLLKTTAFSIIAQVYRHVRARDDWLRITSYDSYLAIITSPEVIIILKH